MQDEKVRTAKEWEDPKNITDLQAFLGLANFYRRFIMNYSKIVAPMTRFTGKGVKWEWPNDSPQKKAFESLKLAFTTVPILQHFDFEKAIVVETDASDFVSAGVLSQPDDNGVLRPVAFFSKKQLSTANDLNILLQAYGLPIKRTLPQRRRQFKKFIGIVMVFVG